MLKQRCGVEDELRRGSLTPSYQRSLTPGNLPGWPVEVSAGVPGGVGVPGAAGCFPFGRYASDLLIYDGDFRCVRQRLRSRRERLFYRRRRLYGRWLCRSERLLVAVIVNAGAALSVAVGIYRQVGHVTGRTAVHVLSHHDGVSAVNAGPHLLDDQLAGYGGRARLADDGDAARIAAAMKFAVRAIRLIARHL